MKIWGQVVYLGADPGSGEKGELMRGAFGSGLVLQRPGFILCGVGESRVGLFPH